MMPRFEKEFTIEMQQKTTHEKMIIAAEEYIVIRGRIQLTDIANEERHFPFCAVYSHSSRGLSECPSSPNEDGHQENPS